ncbi:dihydrofolate reductase [Methylocapsa sp. S129]|uniref:dihydrofolate reductase n=1 Tax=Methylocapsa sp. S129 TaxID=1641869 RepID=UPI00131E51A5|nr:dihydrofolate reductase [Methylocapsa sp. S129]
MLASYRIEGYVIASSDCMIADANAVMPETLKIEADHRFLDHELNRFDVLVHGRHSHEGQSNSPHRRRLVVTRQVAAIAPNPRHPKSLLWNPAGASFEAACGALDLAAGAVAILGGTHVYDLFLEIGYDAFHLSRARNAKLPGGTPVFSQVRSGRSTHEVLARAGLEPGPTQVLDEVNAVSVVKWTRKASA